MDVLSLPAKDAQHAAASLGSGVAFWHEAQSDARARTGSRDKLRLLAGAVGAADAVVILVLSLVAFIARHGIGAVPLDIIATSGLACLLTLNALSLSGSYTTHVESGLWPQTRRAARAWSIVFVLLLAIGYLSKTLSEYSRLWAVMWFVSVLLGLTMVRLAASAKLRGWRRCGRLTSTVAIVDLAGRGADLARRVAGDPAANIRLLGVFSVDDTKRPHSGIDDLAVLSGLFRIDEVFVLVTDRVRADLPAVLRRLATIPTNVRICPFLPTVEDVAIRRADMVHGIPMLTVQQRPIAGWSSVGKRAEDLVIGSLALLLIWPVMAIVAIAIKLDSPGPVLFGQARLGFNNNVITVLKFRSMTHQPVADHKVMQATRDDKRVTRVGRILRRLSFDELPQIINVLRGEMSLVGPRPHAVVHNQHYASLIDGYLGRHRVQPGITGWAQVNGLRGETDTLDKMQKRVEYDLSYINNWSFLLDLRIIAATALSVFFHRQAY